MRFFVFLLFCGFLFSCENEKKPLPVGKIIDKTIENAGGEKYRHAEISFLFRGKKYKSVRNCGMFSLERISEDSLGNIRDVVTNEGFSRYRNGSLQSLADSMAVRYKNSVNSVHYFVQLPFGLNAPAVNKTLIGTDSIAGKIYYEIKVGFDQQGGGSDHEDAYVYWINKNDFTVDYLAYRYHTNGGGVRFREAFNPRKIGGICFVDYRNFAPENLDVKLSDLDSLFSAGKLNLFSTIENTKIEVKPTPGKC